MARVTVEDCIEFVDNRFELVLLASQRSRALSSGAMITLDRGKDKNPVVALREIAGQTISMDDLRETIVRGYQKNLPVEEDEEDLESILAADQEDLKALESLNAAEEEQLVGESFVVEGEEEPAMDEGAEEESAA